MLPIIKTRKLSVVRIFSGLFFLVLIFTSNKLLVSQQDNYHTWLKNQLENEHGITGGSWVFSNNEASTMGSAYASSEVQKDENTIEDQPFTRSLIVTTFNRPENPWTNSIQFSTQSQINQNDVMFLVVWVRGISGERGRGFMDHRFEIAEPPYTSSFSMKQAPAEEWQQLMIPFEASVTSSSSWYKIHLGFQIQQIELGGMAMINYGNQYSVDELPASSFHLDYEGRDPNAAWRAEADARIETHRKADIKILIVDANNEPIADADVEINMKRHAFGFGTSVYVPERATSQFNHSQAELDAYYGAFEDLTGDGRGFNWAVVDDEMRWKTWENPYWPGDGQQHTVNFFEWLKDREITVRGHMLVWPEFHWLPDDIEQHQDDPEYIRQRINSHIESIVGHDQFKGRMVDWNVINEPAHLTDLQNVFGGIDEYAEWFKLAHETDPTADLYINEYGILSNGGMDLNTQERYKEIIEHIDDKGGNVDGVGMEGHVGYPLTPPALIYEIIDEYANLGTGKKISISEYDALNVEESIGGDYMRDMLTMAFSHPAVESILVWGYWDKNHWLGDAPLFRDDWSLKPSGEKFIDLIFNQWWTNETGMTDIDGNLNSRGFLGEYEVKVTKSGGTTINNIILTKDNNTFKIIHSPDGIYVTDNKLVFLEQNYPNPFQDQTEIAFTLVQPEDVELAVYNFHGKKLSVVVNGPLSLGKHKYTLNLSDWPAGVYVYQLKTESGGIVTRKMNLIK